MHRLPDWKPRLTAYVVKAASTPFQYGVHDCALFAAGAVVAQCGLDHADHFRGQYRNLRAGLRLLKRSGYADHVALASAILPDRHPALMRPGDLAVIEDDGRLILGVVQGECIYAVTPAGIGRLSIDRASRILGVG